MIPYETVMSIGLDMIYSRACTSDPEVLNEILVISHLLLAITKAKNQPAATNWSGEEIEL